MNHLIWPLLIGGLLFVAISGIGLMRMPSFLVRIQVVSKAATLGTLFCLVAACISSPDWSTILKSILIVVFLLLSTPTATHALADTSKKISYD